MLYTLLPLCVIVVFAPGSDFEIEYESGGEEDDEMTELPAYKDLRECKCNPFLPAKMVIQDEDLWEDFEPLPTDPETGAYKLPYLYTSFKQKIIFCETSK